jgi:transposase
MSTSLLYHGFGIRGYTYVRTEYEGGTVIFTIGQERGALRCAACGSRRVTRRGLQPRRFRSLPIGSRAVEIALEVPRVGCAEQRIVHGGLQSMPMDYNNVNTPWYSEAEREWATAQDWTAEGADTLILWVRGNAANGPAPLYVVVEDSSKKTAIATHSNPDVVKATTWIEWAIPLSSLTGVNLAKVKKLYIGAGDRKTPVAGGSGRIYVDDIRVTKP